MKHTRRRHCERCNWTGQNGQRPTATWRTKRADVLHMPIRLARQGWRVEWRGRRLMMSDGSFRAQASLFLVRSWWSKCWKGPSGEALWPYSCVPEILQMRARHRRVGTTPASVDRAESSFFLVNEARAGRLWGAGGLAVWSVQFFRSSRKSPRARSRCRSLQGFWRLVGNYIFRNHVVPRNETLQSTIFRYLWITLMSRDKRKHAFEVLHEATIAIGISMETSHCLNRVSVWHDARCSARRIHQKEKCVFKADRRRNRSQQEQETFDQKNAPICQKAYSVKPDIKLVEEESKLDAAREQHSIYSVPDDDPHCEETRNNAGRTLEMRASAMLCKVTNHTSQPERFWLESILCKWVVKAGHEKTELFTFREM